MLALVLVALDRGPARARGALPARVRASASGAARPPKTVAARRAGAGPRSRSARPSSRSSSSCRSPCSSTGRRAASSSAAGSTSPGRRRCSSVSASALAAVVAVVAVLPVALLAERYPARWTRTLERLAYTGNALPGIVIALSLVFFAANYADAALPDARAARVRVRRPVLPAGARRRRVGAAGACTRGSRRRARSLGRGPLRVLATVTVPLIRRGLLAGAALVFLSAMKELPATLLLRPIGFDTLATEIWKYTALGSYSRAAPPALAADRSSPRRSCTCSPARRGSDVSAPG